MQYRFQKRHQKKTISNVPSNGDCIHGSTLCRSSTPVEAGQGTRGLAPSSCIWMVLNPAKWRWWRMKASSVQVGKGGQLQPWHTGPPRLAGDSWLLAITTIAMSCTGQRPVEATDNFRWPGLINDQRANLQNRWIYMTHVSDKSHLILIDWRKKRGRLKRRGHLLSFMFTKHTHSEI